MAYRPLFVALVCGLVLGVQPALVRPGRLEARQRPTLDAVLASYMNGDSAAVARAFATSRDFQAFRVAESRSFEGWLGGWSRAKAVFLLELISKATEVAPQYARPLVDAGRRYVLAARRQAAGDDATFLATWHRAALGLLQKSGAVNVAEEHLDIVLSGPGAAPAKPDVDPRLRLGRAILQEQRCRSMRAGLDWAGSDVEKLLDEAGVEIDDPNRPSRSIKAARVERARQCMLDAVARFEEAAGSDETRAEARVRGAWLLFQQGTFQDALEWLDAAAPGGDRCVAYWAALFRGRVEDALGHDAEAAEAYRAALDIAPGAQSAGIGLALALVRLDRFFEADELARALRASAATSIDPWWDYDRADNRFVGLWIGQLREASR